ncbi:DUF1611 domain-containing protein [Chondrinema litorale]|uniref:DUF1611 domain-containing protein n=1 Tax=Chondrinema litorale TaxID=2994555 RepID=UPI002543479A|nr:DUF1611 domain-containing protein [Chondrinema litorale]UZR92645.1 DUF1611 domain-containing protein [Chondrinema litorale]
MDGNAIVLTNGLLDHHKAKTAHGLIRGSDRYNIVGIIDHKFVGKDAGEVLDGKKRNIPVYGDIETFTATSPVKAEYMIVGIATKGGVLPDEMKPFIKSAIKAGYSIVSGLHEFLSETPEIVELANVYNVKLIDVRKPKPNKDLHFWTGKISNVACPKIPVIGTDCNMGKRTTSRFLKEAVSEAGLNTQMIYTGQTGWMQSGQYGFIFDSTLNDFISGEIEHAIVTCWENEKPDVIFIEGQSALQNPTGPCGTEFLISAEADAVILQHAPKREFFHGCEGYKRTIPTLEQEIALIKMYGVKTMAVTLNTEDMTKEEALEYQKEKEASLGIPVILPLDEGVGRLAETISEFVKNYQHS